MSIMYTELKLMKDPVAKVLRDSLSYLDHDEIVFCHANGESITIKEILHYLDNDHPLAYQFLEDVYGASVQKVKQNMKHLTVEELQLLREEQNKLFTENAQNTLLILLLELLQDPRIAYIGWNQFYADYEHYFIINDWRVGLKNHESEHDWNEGIIDYCFLKDYDRENKYEKFNSQINLFWSNFDETMNHMFGSGYIKVFLEDEYMVIQIMDSRENILNTKRIALIDL